MDDMTAMRRPLEPTKYTLVPLIDTILSVDIYVTTAMSVHANLSHIQLEPKHTLTSGYSRPSFSPS